MPNSELLPRRQAYPSVFSTPEQQAKYEAARAEIRKAMQPLFDELDECTKLTAADYAITINAR